MQHNKRPEFPTKRVALTMGTTIITGLLASVFIAGQPMCTSKPTPAPIPKEVGSIRQFPVAEGVTLKSDTILQFHKASVKDVMDAISYCFHVPVVYKGKPLPTSGYSGSLSTKTGTKEIVDVLNLTGIKATYDGMQIVVGN